MRRAVHRNLGCLLNIIDGLDVLSSSPDDIVEVGQTEVLYVGHSSSVRS